MQPLIRVILGKNLIIRLNTRSLNDYTGDSGNLIFNKINYIEMNRMARETLWYLGGLIFQFMSNIKTNKNETIKDPIINQTQDQQTNVVQATWMQYLWDLIIKNQG